jgi:hypothetical protein
MKIDTKEEQSAVANEELLMRAEFAPTEALS